MKVQVRNLHSKEYREEFRDEMIVIPAGGTHEMGRSEALTFLGTFANMETDGQGLPKFPKMLRIEEDPEQHAAHRGQPDRFAAPDGKMFKTEAGLLLYEDKLAAEAEPEGKVTDDKPRPRQRTRVTTAKR